MVAVKAFIGAILGALILLMGAAPAGTPRVRAATVHAPADAGVAEGCFSQDTNATRGSVSRSSLALSAQLSDQARAHSQQMADSNTLYHSTIRQQYGSSWTLIGENVGTDNSCDVVNQAFLNSPHHYDNIVNSAWTSFGVGVVFGANGTVWCTVAFVEGSAPAAAPAPVARAPVPAPPAPVAVPRPAVTQARQVAPVRPASTASVAPPPSLSPAAVAPSLSPAPSAASNPTTSALSLQAQRASVQTQSTGSTGPAIIGLVAALALGLGATGTWFVRERVQKSRSGKTPGAWRPKG